MSFEVLSKSLQMAVNQAFVIDEIERAEITACYRQMNIQMAHEVLRQIHADQSTGLRFKVAEAYMSADKDTIRQKISETHLRAIHGIGRTILRQKVQSTQKNRFAKRKDSTIMEISRKGDL